MLSLRNKRKSRAISELISTLILIAITLVAGAAVFGFVNGQAKSSAGAIGNNAAGNINFLNEREVIVGVCLTNSTGGCQASSLCSSSAPCGADVFVYNNGQISPETMAGIQVTLLSSSGTVSRCPLTGQILISTQIIKGQVGTISLSSTTCGTTFFVSGASSPNSYTFEVTGQYGSTAQFTEGF